MEIIYRKLSELKKLEGNPRRISPDMMKKLKESISHGMDYFEARPLILSDRTGELVILAGNQRYEACKQLGIEEAPTVLLPGLTEEREREIIIRDNVSNGEWDFDILADWSADELESWGVMMPEEEEEGQSATQRLSGLEYKPMYYEPQEMPNLNLPDCVNLDKFNAKLAALEEYDLTEEQKEALKMFAYRFIKIDFEAVANYYYFNASEEEKKAIERLRLVLVDNGINGFVNDDMLRIAKEDIELFNKQYGGQK